MFGANVQTIELSLTRGNSFTLADREARRAVPELTSNLRLVGWWDENRRSGGPVEACGDQSHACVTSYAEHHGAAYHVLVNEGTYEFFYATTPRGTETLDSRVLADVHRDLVLDQYENVQGG
jgi:hypothetical protein